MTSAVLALLAIGLAAGLALAADALGRPQPPA